MESYSEKRNEGRLRFFWPLWFGYEDNGELFRGQAIDLTRNFVSFTTDEHLCPAPGTHVTTKFSFPRSGSADGFGMGRYQHWSEVVRVDKAPAGKRRVAMRLHQELDFDPGESADAEAMEIEPVISLA